MFFLHKYLAVYYQCRTISNPCQPCTKYNLIRVSLRPRSANPQLYPRQFPTLITSSFVQGIARESPGMASLPMTQRSRITRSTQYIPAGSVEIRVADQYGLGIQVSTGCQPLCKLHTSSPAAVFFPPASLLSRRRFRRLTVSRKNPASFPCNTRCPTNLHTLPCLTYR